jgi:hypothetical protein
VAPRTHRLPCAAAAKKGGGGGGKKGGGGNKKGPSTLIPKEKPPYADVGVVMATLLLVESYRRATGRALLGGKTEDADGLDIADAPRALFEAPGVAVLSHDGAADPVFTYANAAALAVFQAEKWSDLVGLPSRLSAEDVPEVQADRAALLAAAAESPTGAVSGYRGWRVGRAGRRFEIQDGTLWQVTAPSGDTVGQAVVFSHVAFEDGSEWGAGSAGSGGEAADNTPTAPPPDPAALEAARAAVAAAATAVRALKEGKGLTNQDEEVVEAVDELLGAKAALAALEDAWPGGRRS